MRVSARFVLAALASVAFIYAAPAAAQTFAVGGGAFLANDTGSVERPSSFSTWGGSLFGELEIEPGAFLQLRASRFSLPGSVTTAPNLRVDAATISVGYLFREEWWSVGFFAGGGLYRLTPKDLEEGQTAADEKESVAGWQGGLLTTFVLAPRWELRLEASGHLIRSTVSHQPILLGGSIAYRF